MLVRGTPPKMAANGGRSACGEGEDHAAQQPGTRGAEDTLCTPLKEALNTICLTLGKWYQRGAKRGADGYRKSVKNAVGVTVGVTNGVTETHRITPHKGKRDNEKRQFCGKCTPLIPFNTPLNACYFAFVSWCKSV